MASSLIVTLMARPSIARELARENIDDHRNSSIGVSPSPGPHRPIRQPVLLRLLRLDGGRSARVQGDGTGVLMTTTREQALSSEEPMADLSPWGTDDSEKQDSDSHCDREVANLAPELDSGKRQSLARSLDGHRRFPIPMQRSQPLGSVIACPTIAELGGAGLHDVRAPADSARLIRSAEGSPIGQQYGITPRGRLVPMPTSFSDQGHHI